jgi:hypothetical protein
MALTKHTITLPNQERLYIQYEIDYRNFKVTQNNRPLFDYMSFDELRLGRTVNSQAGEPIHFILDNNGVTAWHQNIELIADSEKGTYDFFSYAIIACCACGVITAFVHADKFDIAKSHTINVSIICVSLFLLGLWANKSDKNFPLFLALGVITFAVSISAIGLIFGIIMLITLLFGIINGPQLAKGYQAESNELLDRHIITGTGPYTHRGNKKTTHPRDTRY